MTSNSKYHSNTSYYRWSPWPKTPKNMAWWNLNLKRIMVAQINYYKMTSQKCDMFLFLKDRGNKNLMKSCPLSYQKFLKSPRQKTWFQHILVHTIQNDQYTGSPQKTQPRERSSPSLATMIFSKLSAFHDFRFPNSENWSEFFNRKKTIWALDPNQNMNPESNTSSWTIIVKFWMHGILVPLIHRIKIHHLKFLSSFQWL